MKTFDSGARSSEESPRIDLIPAISLIRQAARMAEGAASHGERNYEKGASDPVFIRDRKNHLVMHALAYLHGQDDDDHLGAILANAGMLARLEQMNAVPVRESPAFVTNEQPAIAPSGNALTPILKSMLCEMSSAAERGAAGVTTCVVRGSQSTITSASAAPRSYDDIRNEAGPCPHCERKSVTHPGSCKNALECKFGR